MYSQPNNQHYEKLRNRQENAEQVGWKSRHAQEVRFLNLMRVVDNQTPFSLNDFGCGLGDLYDFLIRNKYPIAEYVGYDISPAMVNRAEERFTTDKNAYFVLLDQVGKLRAADFMVASGIFNLKFDATDDEQWLQYIFSTIEILNHQSHRGFSFNMLTRYSDAHLMRKELYYGDPLVFFDHCKKTYSRNVALLHDYDEYDFTIIVRK